VGAAPDFEPELRKLDRLLMGDAEDVQVLHHGQHAMAKHRLRDRGIMIARQQHDRHAGGGDHRCGAVEHMLRQAVAFEGIADQQHYVGADPACRGKDASEARRSVAAVDARRVVMIHVQIRGMNNDDVPAHRPASPDRTVGTRAPSTDPALASITPQRNPDFAHLGRLASGE